MRRRIAPVIAVTALAATAALTACTAVAPADTCEPLVSPGALTASVEVSGKTADDLRVDVNKQLRVLNSQRGVVVASADREGAVPVEPGDIVATNLAYVDASSGELLEVSPGFGSGRGSDLFLADPGSNTIVSSTLCAVPGETLAIALSAEESAAMGVDGSLLVIAEIVEVYGSRAAGAPRALPSGFPAVATDDTGRPGVVLPPQQAPSETRSATRIQGNGAKVEVGDQVIGQVLSVGWNGEVQRNTWETAPVNFGNEEQVEQSGATFRAELTGLRVGSQIVVIEPGEGSPVVSVIDILAVV